MQLFTIGHSNRSIGEFCGLLKANGIQKLADIRAVTRSRHNPQFNEDSLKSALAEERIDYRSFKALGGMRKARKDSPNQGLGEGFRGYADYMQTAEFADALEALLDWSEGSRVALMCAEANPAQCHRLLTSDALAVRGVFVTHILSAGKTAQHVLTPFAEVKGAGIIYPFALT